MELKLKSLLKVIEGTIKPIAALHVSLNIPYKQQKSDVYIHTLITHMYMAFPMCIYTHKGSSNHKHIPMHVCMRQ